jgi:hypothetical protein
MTSEFDLRLALSRIAARLRECAALLEGGHEPVEVGTHCASWPPTSTACGPRCRRTDPVISKRLWVAQAVWLSVLCTASCCPTPPAVALAMGGGGGDGGGLGGTIPATEWCQMRARPNNTASTEPSKSYAQAPQPMTIDQLRPLLPKG